ncbi:MAG: PAS domain-containing sensor histidine kinase [Desulfovibrio sp.]|jgi:two-component system phosphate regulon sensor histidine kinase PhoR|nr:PAS domain-containing sensor histidine kinase [Desulfovibrio sp.]
MIRHHGSLRGRLFWAFALVMVVALGLPALFARNALNRERAGLAGQYALAQASFVRRILETGLDETQTRSLFDAAGELSLRLTRTDASGRVLRDSHVEDLSLPDMDNHGDRPEIADARSKGSGTSLRHSDTLGMDAMYAAVPLADGGVLRVALPTADVRRGFKEEASSLGISFAGVGGLCLLLSFIVTGRVRAAVGNMAEVVASISRDKGSRRLREVPGREFLPLAYAVNCMADNIEAYVRSAKDQQSQLENILDTMREGVLVLGPSGNIRCWNKALAAMFPSVVTAAGKPLIEGLPVPALQQRMNALLGRGDAQELFADAGAIQFELPAGRFLVAHFSSPVEENETLVAVVVVHDVTEIMRLENVRRDFVANISHELRTPLTAIAGYAETLLTSVDLPADYREFAGIIHKHASMLARIISDLLALAKIENARENIALAPVNARTALDDALDACRNQAESKNIRFSIDLAENFVLANAPLLTQVFRNLLENACRYSPSGSEVRISSRKEGEKTLFTVADNGSGIPAEVLPRIFERFYQVKKERNSGTSGIGLAICKHIIERHNGRIWAESPHADKSTAMLFTLSAARPFEAEQ